MLIKPDKLKSAKKDQGYIFINKHFATHFMQEIDKMYDLNIHIQRSLPMVYKPAPWKNYNFGAYYLK